MPAYARKEIVYEEEAGIYYCVARCVRRAFLCGSDAATGTNFEHRRGWIRARLEELAGIFAIDVCGYAVMGNEFHVILRTRPDVAAARSDQEVAEQWWRLFPRRRDERGLAAEPEPHELAVLVADTQAAAERRRRLGSLSRLMGCLCEPIARRANREDGCTGRFWEGRFKSQTLLDDAAVLTCAVHVDLNPVLAGIVQKPDECEYASAYDRIVAQRDRRGRQRKTQRRGPASRRREAARDGWLCPILPEGPPRPSRGTSSGKGRARRGAADDADTPRRASSDSFLPLSVEEYLRLLDWTARQVRRDKPAAIPASVAPILERVGVGGNWVETVVHFGRWFHRAVGRPDRLNEEAARRGKCWFQGLAHSRTAFG